MSASHLGIYLNDHLAGSVAAIELLTALEKAHQGTELAGTLGELRADITSDQRELKALMEAINVSAGGARQAVAWVAEKCTRMKLALDDAGDGSLRLLECIEAVALGIEGKRALCAALRVAATEHPKLGTFDADRIERRTIEQRATAERVRLQAVKSAFGV